MAALTEAEQNRLIIENQCLVQPIAAGFRGQKSIPFEDLISEGMVGLVRAARSWQPTGSFGDYADKNIRGAIQHFIRDWQDLATDDDLGDDDDDRVHWWDIWGDIPYEGWTQTPTTPEQIRIAYEEMSENRDAVHAALKSLTRRERRMIHAAFLRDPVVKFEQIARDNKVSYFNAMQIVWRAIAKMRKAVKGYSRNRNNVIPFSSALAVPL